MQNTQQFGNWQIQQQLQPIAYGGPEIGGEVVHGDFACTNNCAISAKTYPTQRLVMGALPSGATAVRTTATARWARGATSGHIWLYLDKPGFPRASKHMTPPIVRCDNARPGASGVGCVFPTYNPVMIYRLNGRYPQLARHIKDAQDSGLPGAYPKGKVLNRITGNDVTKNRDRSCPRGTSGYPRPPGKTCDEYPFASTKQGAYTANPKTPPRDLRRTFPWCKLHNEAGVPYRRGAKGYSVCMIDENHNSPGGRALDDFYLENRVLPPTRSNGTGDAFRVWIQ